MAPTLKERLIALADPSLLLSSAVYSTIIAAHVNTLKKALLIQSAGFIVVLFSTLRTTKTFRIDIEQVKDKAFARFWLSYKPPSDEQQLRGSAALVPSLFRSASGDVLHVGPGNGVQISYFASSGKVNRLYGAEPALGLHDQLAAQIKTAGLEDKYVILPCKADARSIREALHARNVMLDTKGHFDSIVCCRVLCSIPQPDLTIRELYHLLKPHGRLLVLEHVKNPWRVDGSLTARIFQWLYMLLGWSYFIGGCRLDRDLERTLKDVGDSEGGWASMRIERHFGWACLPYLRAELEKP